MSSPGPSCSTPASSGASKPTDLFEDLWRQLRECYQNALQELEAKVTKLKKERCLDAQRLEEFYSRNQQLKEQHKTLQDTISLLEERLRAGVCDRCAVLEENMKNNQNQNLRLIAKLKNEKNSLEDENRKLNAELEKVKTSRSDRQRISSPEQEEGVIPDSPILSSSLPMANKLKRRKNNNKAKHVRYAETPLPQSHSSLFDELNKEPLETVKNHGRADVLVPNTCEMDTSQTSKDVHQNLEEMVAETCALELPNRLNTETAPGLQSSSKSPKKCKVHLRPYTYRLQQSSSFTSQSSSSPTLIHHPDSTTEWSPSLLPRIKRVSDDGCLHMAKRKKEDSGPEVQEEDKQGGVEKQKEGQQILSELIKRPSIPLSSQNSKKEPPDYKVRSAQHGASSQKSNGSCVSPTIKRTNGKNKEEANMDLENHRVGKKRNPLQDLNASPDPPPPADGLGEKANDSLDQMFDTTADGEYKSYNSFHSGQTQRCHDNDDDDDEDEEEEDGYIKEETNPQARLRRRQPFNALFSPKRNEQET
ncbi:DNA endonuclease RBBP8 [Centroberyx affinis]|uniref:DNA endonuclease RBBP8 n=1 Tax=Centroberyx affinis TaxID=166261 RepID=UPI003A5C364E